MQKIIVVIIVFIAASYLIKKFRGSGGVNAAGCGKNCGCGKDPAKDL